MSALLLTLHLAVATPALASPPAGPKPGAAAAASEALEEGHHRYYQGDGPGAALLYERALKADGRSVEAWVNGGVVWEELGRPEKAAQWYRKALALRPEDPRILTALGWAELRSRNPRSSEARFRAALARDPKEPDALLGLGRAELATDRPGFAAIHFAEAAEADPRNDLAYFWRGAALEAAGSPREAVEAYRQAALDDSYFVEARYALARVFVKLNRFNEAAAQFEKVLDADPENRTLRQLRQRIQRLVTRRVVERRPFNARLARRATPIEVLMPQHGSVPVLRVGIGTSALGKPLPRQALEFQCTTPFSVLDAETGKRLTSGGAREVWRVRVAPGKSFRLEVTDPQGRRAALSRGALRIRPSLERGGSTILHDIPYGRGQAWSGTAPRQLRGEVEVSRHPARRAFRLVNIVDLESYTHGVLSAEMPVTSPLEALKAQAVVARSHALYVKTVTARHRKDGYDLCDDQHCQVYAGVESESDRSRAVVAATRARVLAYQGRVAHVLYSSNCGGHTQSGAEIAGWGDVPYWKGIPDAAPGSPPTPRSPWELRWWLRRTPPAYCMSTPSGHVHPSHHRWTRVVAVRDLQEKLNRREPVGRILALRTLKRSVSGHLNAVLVVGSRRNLKITREISIRSLLGLGSQRSALFAVETDYDARGRPEAFVFHGAGWGHGVGMCQSGAMGRAEQGQLYEDILKAYYPGTELGHLRY